MDKGRILLSLTGFHPQRWHELLSADRPVVLEPETPDDPTIRYAVVWKQRPKLLASLPNLAAIFSIGAGVDHMLADPTVPDVPIVRVVADNLTQPYDGVSSSGGCSTITARACSTAASRPGEALARAAAAGRRRHLSGHHGAGPARPRGRQGAAGARLPGQWLDRRPTAVEGVSTFAGEQGLMPFLNATDMLVVLLPLTPDTQGIVSYQLLRQLRRRNGLGGAVLINAGRGQLQNDADILRALDDGTLKEASLDVFETEPLPRTSPLWTHPKVFVTPHAAATSDPNHLVPPMLDADGRVRPRRAAQGPRGPARGLLSGRPAVRFGSVTACAMRSARHRDSDALDGRLRGSLTTSMAWPLACISVAGRS